MPSRAQPRNHLGRFVHSAQPQQEECEPATPQPEATQPNTIQRLYLAFHTPLVLDVPASEFISNIAQALHLSSPIPNSSESPLSLPFASESILSPPICYVPPLRDMTNLSISTLVFNAFGSDPLPPMSSPLQLPNASFGMPQHSTHLSDDELSYADDEQFVQLPPPLPPHPYQAPPQPPRHLPCTRFLLPQRLHSRALPQPPPMRPLTATAAFTTPTPTPTFVSVYGVGAMPSV